MLIFLQTHLFVINLPKKILLKRFRFSFYHVEKKIPRNYLLENGKISDIFITIEVHVFRFVFC